MSPDNPHKVNRVSLLCGFWGARRWLLVAGLVLAAWHSGRIERVEVTTSHPFPSSQMEFEATAYCDQGITKSGVPVATGIVAADPSVLPLGSLIRLETTEYSGIYRVMDTGGLIKGKIIDIFIPSREMALEFGRQKVKIRVLRYGYPRPSYATLTD